MMTGILTTPCLINWGFKTIYTHDAHFKLDVQFCHRAGEHAEIRQNMFAEVRHKSSGMHIFLYEYKEK